MKLRHLVFAALTINFCCLGGLKADLVINEIRIDNPGTDTDEYFELYADGSNEDLNNLTYIVIGDGAGGSGTVENVTSLSGQGTLNSGNFFLVAEASFTLSGTVNFTTSLNFENSDNVTHLLVAGFSGANGDDLDTNDDGVLDVTPWSSIVDSVALLETTDIPASGEYVYSSTTVGPDGPFVPGHVYRNPDGTAGVWTIGAFDPVGGDDTPGASNASVIPEPTTFGLLGLAAIAGFGFSRRRK